MRKILKILKNQLPLTGSLPSHIPTHPTQVLFSSSGTEVQVSWRDEGVVGNSEQEISSQDFFLIYS